MTMQYEEREPLSVRPQINEPPWHMSWSAVFAGSVLSMGIWLLLHLLGMGVGLTAIDPDSPHSLRGAGMTTGIWSLIIPIVAMFLGGFAASKVGGAVTRTAAAIQGGVLWSLATIASMFALVSLGSFLLGGAARLGQASMEPMDMGSALQAAEDTGKGLIGMFFAMLLGLIAAVVGSIVGISRAQRAVAERVNERASRLAERHA